MTRERALDLVATKSWYHTFELLPGVVTPGISEFPAAALLDNVGITSDLKGLNAVDVGTWDGPLAFELERRGAAVTAVDIQDPDNTGFNVAKQVLGSQVNYLRASVYDLPEVVEKPQDIVTFRGVYYHLKYPLLGFEKIAEILSEDGLLHFEGECLLHYAENLDGSRSDLDVKAIAQSQTPMTVCCPGRFKGAGNWIIPNLACLASWLQSCGMQIVHHVYYSSPSARPYPTQRVAGLAKKVGSFSSLEEHPVLRDGWRADWR